jgi:NAD/NADP transhydrogenase beta subunit
LVLAVSGTVVDDAALTVAGIVIGMSGSLLIYVPFRAPGRRREARSSTSDVGLPRAPCV